MPKVSIIMPVFNSSKYLQEALQSLITQTLHDIEIICVDDGSTDDSYDILKRFANKDKRIRLAKNMEVTDGAAEARNIGMRMAESKWLVFMDSDDFAEPDMLEKAYLKAEMLQPDILMFDAWYYDDDKQVDFVTNYPLDERFLPQKEVFVPADNKSKIFRMTHGAVWGRLFKREFVNRYDLCFFSCNYWDDIEFFYPALCLADKVAVLREKLLHYRWNALLNQSSQVGKYPNISYKATLEIKRRFKLYRIFDEYRVSLLNLLCERALSVLHWLTDDDVYEKLFWEFKKTYLEKIGFYELSDDEFDNEQTLTCRNLINDSKTPLEYAIRRSNMYLHNVEKTMSALALLAKSPARILLYGAGINGRAWFNRILDNPGYMISGWVDKRFERMGYPVQNPAAINSLEYDYIMITIENRLIAQEISDSLESLGVLKNKIIWPYK